MIEHQVLSSSPYYVSNDVWRPVTARHLKEHLGLLQDIAHNTAALVVGAGTLPYTLDILPRTVIVDDKEESVVRSVIDRCHYVAAECESWEQLDAAFPRLDLPSERARIQQAGLLGNFEDVKRAACRTNFIPLIGNIVDGSEAINQQLRPNGLELVFVNFTNVSQHLGALGLSKRLFHSGRTVLAAFLETLPLHEKAVICDSTLGLESTLYTPSEYIALQLQPQSIGSAPGSTPRP